MGANVLYGVGATKAGTSWLYRALHDHPDCAVRAVKEFHYWDSFTPAQRDWQAGVFRRKLAEFEAARGGGGRMSRQMRDMTALLAVIEGDRDGDAAYAAFLGSVPAGRLAADITPSYALQPVSVMERMMRAFPAARVLYLLRDPVSRLWSQARMQAKRMAAPCGIEEAANRVMARVLRQGGDPGLLERGNYPSAVERLLQAVPRGQLRVAYSENVLTAEGWDGLQGWLGIERRPADLGRAHVGTPARLREDLRREALTRLRPHYDWAARVVGPLPPEWLATLERA